MIDYTLQTFKNLGYGRDRLSKAISEYNDANTEHRADCIIENDGDSQTVLVTANSTSLCIRRVGKALTVKSGEQVVLDLDSDGLPKIYDRPAIEELVREQPKLFELLNVPHPDDMALFTSVCTVFNRVSVPSLVRIFRDYAESIGYSNGNRRRKNHAMTYSAYDDFGDGARGFYTLYDTDEQYLEHKPRLEIVMRAKHGEYFIIGAGGERFCEVDSSGYIWSWEPAKLREIISEHKAFFDKIRVVG